MNYADEMKRNALEAIAHLSEIEKRDGNTPETARAFKLLNEVVLFANLRGAGEVGERD